ncbi:MAG: pyridoxal 5'-phosphate synthase glutaminase subunit PdxT [Lentisphaeria bacterium]|nr:pyridoxal 5'-phosphate synthase glutaminase subunit PdxT [Lentisphaeria bacterium]
MKIAVLALQGDFEEHQSAVERLSIETLQLRQRSDLEQEFDALILPGGESTVQGKLLRELDMFDPICERIKSGLPVMATCAGLILLAREIAGSDVRHFGVLDVTVQRNAYGRQLESFQACGKFTGADEEIPMSFIRAPRIERVGSGVEVLAKVGDTPVAVRENNILGMAFHPEVSADNSVMRYFIENIVRQK